MLTLVWVDEDPTQIQTVRQMFEEYQHELGIDLCFQGFQDELDNLPGKYAPPNGALLLLESGGQFVACGALREHGDGACELKRLYVQPAHRGCGMGKRLTVELMDRAKSIGYQTVRLDTLRRLSPAINLYYRLGFQEIGPYNINPEPDIVYLERDLLVSAK